MDWLRDPVWQQGLAILLVVVGAILIYGAIGTKLNAIAILGTGLFAIGVAVPLISQALAAHRERTARSEDV